MQPLPGPSGPCLSQRALGLARLSESGIEEGTQSVCGGGYRDDLEMVGYPQKVNLQAPKDHCPLAEPTKTQVRKTPLKREDTASHFRGTEIPSTSTTTLEEHTPDTPPLQRAPDSSRRGWTRIPHPLTLGEDAQRAAGRPRSPC